MRTMWGQLEMIREEIERYLDTLEADLEVEIDIHGGNTVLARNLRSLIVSTKLELDQ